MTWGGLFFTCILLAACRSSPAAIAPTGEGSSPAERTVSILVTSTLSAASAHVDDAKSDESPTPTIERSGQATLATQSKGHTPTIASPTTRYEGAPTPSETPADSSPPRVRLEPGVTSVGSLDGLKISATAEDNVDVTYMALYVDNYLVYEVEGAFLRHNLDTSALAWGQHILLIEARDAAGNVGQEEIRIEVLAPTDTPRPPKPTPTARPTASVTPTALPSPPTTATSIRVATNVPPTPVQVYWDELTIDTYAYEQALYTYPEGAGHPYPLLHKDRVGPPRPRKYQVLMVSNEYLELTLMPELGGRIYQCRFLPTGQRLFYNNHTIKPTHWGPEDQGWWLAVGGLEFCLPVEEHGYLTAEPWTPDILQHEDGSVTVTMKIEESSRHIQARVGITLRPGESAFHVQSTLRNVGVETESLQYWINAMLSPGAHGIRPSLRFYYPASRVIVHSRGDGSLPDAHAIMPWPEYDGRDLSRYANWRDWLGFFAPELSEPFTAIYDEETQLGMVRVFPPDVARGAKLFGFGRDFGDVGAYTDDGSQYVEMWGGLTPTFWDYAELAPQEHVTWQETWYPVSRCGGVSMATADATLNVLRGSKHLDLSVVSPRVNHWTLSVTEGGQEVSRQEFVARPDVAFYARVTSISGNPDTQITVSILDAMGNSVLSFGV